MLVASVIEKFKKHKIHFEIIIKSDNKLCIIYRINGILENNGHSVVFHLNSNEKESNSQSSTTSPSSTTQITITGGPLAYSYVFDSLYLHFGRTDSFGSEHSIAGYLFPAEVSQLD